MTKSVNEIIKENKTRRAVFSERYDPVRGVGSHIKRFELYCGRYGTFHLPIRMKELTLIQDILSRKIKVNKGILARMLILRRTYDFEYYAYIALKITDKESGRMMPFLLNYPQRAILLPQIYNQIDDDEAIRIFLLKARQWGGSTLIDAIAVWIQTEVKKSGWNSCIVADVEEQARNIRSMTTKFSDNFPKNIGTLTMKAFEGSSKNKEIVETGNVISMGSMQQPESLRSGDIKIAHLSEVGLWKKTKNRKPKDLIQSLRGTVPNLPWTIFALESTAKGMGNYFHDQYLNILKGKSDLALVFVPWFMIEMYQVKIKGSVEDFIRTWKDHEWELWNLGATIEGIKWYQFKAEKEYSEDEWGMKSEFPSTADEAFQSTGRRYFPVQYVLKARENNRKPEKMGDLAAKEEGTSQCVYDIEFHSYNGGPLWLWTPPDKSLNILNRYIVAVDVGGRSDAADYSVIRVLDRYNLMYDDKPEVVCTWYGHLEYDLLAWKAVQIATWYNNALLVIESNFYDNKGEFNEGDQYFTILDTISNHYDQLYTRTTVAQIKEGAPLQWGFHTNRQTKPMILSNLLTYLRDQKYIEPMTELCTELDTFETRANNTTGAVEGAHDDILMATAILLWISENAMDKPYEVKRSQRNYRRTVINDSSF